MLVGENSLGRAARVGGSEDGARRRRLRWTGAMAASYAVDTLFLGLFAAAGTIPPALPLGYGIVTAAVCALAWLAIVKGWNLRLRDPNLVEPLMVIAVLLQLGVAVAAPQVAFLFLANLFTAFAFGLMWLDLRRAVAVCLAVVFGAGIVFAAVGERIGAPAVRPVEVFLAWSFFSLILGRCLLVSVAANESRARLAESRRKLGDTLEQVQRLASRDELTRALNRRSLVSALERECARAERGGSPFCVAMIDLDRFKIINDTHGHAAGDAVLRAFAATVHDTMRATDVFGRYGGEEFMLILVGASTSEASDAVERVRATVAGLDWRSIVSGMPVTMSAGIAGFRKGESVEGLLQRSDRALYEAKRGGRNRTVLGAA
jgi:diguanylate cyclase (GGDEF)-like protein